MTFAIQFDQNFRRKTKKYSHSEIPLFRALHSTLAGMGNRFQVEEYHGGSHQVRFTGNGTYTRTNARCELSDLLIIVFSSRPSPHVRLTYLQAKLERKQLITGNNRKYSANLEQWYLLSRRPLVSRVGLFNPPSRLLKSALLPSVGSFGFFYKDVNNGFQIHYVSADNLKLAGKYTQRNGKLIAKTSNCTRRINGYDECISANGNVSFAKALYRLEIGTPICNGRRLVPRDTSIWLASNLQALIEHARINDERTELAGELIRLLEPETLDLPSSSLGAKEIIIIKSDEK